MLSRRHLVEISGLKAVLLVLASVAALSGCAAFPVATYSAIDAAIRADSRFQLERELASTLSQAPAGTVLVLSDSPWGSPVEVTVESAYLAASGRECRRLAVLSADRQDVEHALICQAGQVWEVRRLVTAGISE